MGYRIALVPADQGPDHAIQSGREQQGLVLLFCPTQDPLDLGHEAHVGHAVGFVNDHADQVGYREFLLLDEVDHAARGGDHKVDPLAESGDLLLDRGAAVDGLDAQSTDLGQRFKLATDLDCQFTGGHEGQGSRPLRGPSGQSLDQRNAEGQCLTRTGLCLAADVTTGQAVRNGKRLDIERSRDAPLGEGINQVLVDAQIGELGRRHVFLCFPAAILPCRHPRLSGSATALPG